MSSPQSPSAEASAAANPTAATGTEVAPVAPLPPPARPRVNDPQRWHLDAREESEAEGWLMTYLDVITLLLVLLLVMLAFRGTRTELAQPPEAEPAASPPAAPAVEEPAGADPWQQLSADHFGQDVELLVAAEQISFRISDAILFASGQAELSERGFRVLDRLLPTLAASPMQLVVEGHTDDQPIVTARYPSNWELSTARAARVVRYLQQRGIDPQRLRATGYGAARPIADNGDPGQRGRNRRVDLVLLRDG